MDPSAPTPKAKMWFPWFKLSMAFIVIVGAMYLTLELFNPHIDPDPKEWDSAPSKKIKQIEMLYKLLNKKK